MIAVVSSHTGGHLYPGVAIKQMLNKDIMFFLPNHSVCVHIVKIYGLRACYFSVSKKPWRLLWQFFSFIKLFKCHRVSKLIATGGGACLTAIMAARFLGIEVVLLEQNVLPGRLNRYLSVFAKYVITSFQESQPYFLHKKSVVCWGNPIRKEYAVSKAQTKIALPDYQNCWAVLGGSQGAWNLNRWVEDVVYAWIMSQDRALVHIVGDSYYQQKKYKGDYIRKKGEKGEVLILPNWEAMDRLYHHINAIICRSGASTLAELLHFKVASFLVPFPYAKDNHQQVNAEWMANKGFSKWLPEASLYEQANKVLNNNWQEPILKNLKLFHSQQSNFKEKMNTIL